MCVANLAPLGAIYNEERWQAADREEDRFRGT
jgi:hypothetical protein